MTSAHDDDSRWTRRLTEAWVRDHQLPPGVDRERWADEHTRGLLLVVGRRDKVFIVRRRIDGQRRDVRIGAWNQFGAGPNGADRWTVDRARAKAREIVVAVELGVFTAEPEPAPKAKVDTLDAAFDAHAESLRKKIKGGTRSEATLIAFEKSRTKIRQVWPELLDEPVGELTGEVLTKLMDLIKSTAAPRSNAVNEAGAPLATRVMRNLSAAWATLNRRRDGKLGNWNPSKSVEKDALRPKRVVVADLPDWYARVQSMSNPIQRDGMVVALFTGLRHEDICTMRFDDVDLDERTLRIPDPKGGEARAFTLPLTDTVAEIIERRRADNAGRLRAANRGYKGDDGGYVFPALSRNDKPVPIGGLREQRYEKTRKVRYPAEDVHTLRRTFTTVAQEVGVSDLDMHVLTNHAFGSASVNDRYITQHIDHLARCAALIEAELWARIRPQAPKATSKPKPKTKLRSV